MIFSIKIDERASICSSLGYVHEFESYNKAIYFQLYWKSRQITSNGYKSFVFGYEKDIPSDEF